MQEVQNSNIESHDSLYIEIRDLLLSFKESGESNRAFLSRVSNMSGVSVSSISRIIYETQYSRPTAGIVLKIFQAILGDKDAHLTVSKLPSNIQTWILDGVDSFSYSQSRIADSNIDDILLEDHILREIYIFSSAKSPYLTELEYRFGGIGKEKLEKALSLRILKIDQNSGSPKVVAGPKKPLIGHKYLTSTIKYLINNHLSEEKLGYSGENYATLITEGLSPEGYNELLKLSFETFQKAKEITSNSKYKGHIPAFSAFVVDNMSKGFIYDQSNKGSENEIH